jgi:hypothetical protein
MTSSGISAEQREKQKITKSNLNLTRGTTDESPVMGVEEQPQVKLKRKVVFQA